MFAISPKNHMKFDSFNNFWIAFKQMVNKTEHVEWFIWKYINVYEIVNKTKLDIVGHL